MRTHAFRRLQALILTAVLLIGGSGASALDLALYHLGGAPAEGISHRIAGTDAPRPHGDSCVLLDWTTRGPHTVALIPLAPRPVPPETDRSRPVPADAPRSADLSPAHRPRPPPVPLD
jgi:hypothetical protein